MLYMNDGIMQDPPVNVPVYVLQRLEGRRAQIRDQLKGFKRKRAEIQKRLGEVTTDDADNIYFDLIDSFLRECDSQIEQGETALKELELAFEIARRYRSDVTVPIQRYPANTEPRIENILRAMHEAMVRNGFKAR
jgi:hypothetical protein